MSQRRDGRHGGSDRKKLNRYDPNEPDWKAVHAPWARPRPAPALPLSPDTLAVEALAVAFATDVKLRGAR